MYQRASSGNCDSLGMSKLSSMEECQIAAITLGLSDTTADFGWTQSRPHGCIYASNNRLEWNSPDTSITCGSFHDGEYYDCICNAPGKG